MHNPPELRYTPEHEWIRVEGNRGTVGITHFAQDQLGDIVFVELPEIGRSLNKGELFGVVESVKTVSDLYAPVSGTVVGRNEALADHPELVNQQPTGEGWMIVLELSEAGLSELDSLLSAEAYEARTQGG